MWSRGENEEADKSDKTEYSQKVSIDAISIPHMYVCMYMYVELGNLKEMMVI